MASAGTGAVRIIDDDNDVVTVTNNKLDVNATLIAGAAIDIGDVEILGHGAVSQFTTNIAGTATQLDANACKHADIMAKTGNVGIVYVGGSGVSATTGIALYPGDVYSVDVTNTNLLYGIAVNANDDLQVVFHT
tara:strand:+ start:1294 stop:1695 length:402 start_codon:yes stop_codon:yes gene_type:complete